MLALSACGAPGDAGDTRTFADENVPFTFEVPSEFTDETVDNANSRGDVLAAVGLSKVDVIAVRRGQPLPGPQRHEVLGQDVTSELRAIPGYDGYVLECQYTSERADEVRSACRDALESLQRK